MRTAIMLWGILFFTLDLKSQDVDTTLKMNGGDFSRKNTIIHFPLNKEAWKKQLALTDLKGNIYPIQVNNDSGYVVIPSLQPGISIWKIIENNHSKGGDIEIERTVESIKFYLKGKLVIGYQTGKGELPEGIDPIYRRGAYIHPVVSPSGIQISDDYPLNHKHHHGIWASWTKAEFEGRNPDFWNMGDNKGSVLLEGINEVKEGEVFASLKSRQGYYDFTVEPNKKALDEELELRVYNISGEDKPYYIFDLKISQKCASQSPLILPKYHYGGVGFRGNQQWDGEENTFFLTSEGKTRQDGHGTLANWCYIGGKVDEKLTGITIMSHPFNFRTPQPMRIHPSEPFFNFAPSQAGDWSIQPGDSYIARYRYLVYDGNPDVQLIKNIWEDYAKPVKVEIIK